MNTAGDGGGGGGGAVVVYPEQLAVTAIGFETAADSLESAASTLESALAAEEGCWGTDEPGESFSAGYEPAAAQAAAQFTALVEALRGIRSTLDAATGLFDDTEAGNSGALGGGR